MEEVRTGRKELAAVTMWKTKKSALTDANSTATTQISDSSGFSVGKGSDFAGEKQGKGGKDEQIKRLLNGRELLIEASIRYQGNDFNSQMQRLKLDHEIEKIDKRLEQLGYKNETPEVELYFDGFDDGKGSLQQTVEAARASVKRYGEPPMKEKEKPVSASSSDIETEPNGKQNGTATLQNEHSSKRKGSDFAGDNQGKKGKRPDCKNLWPSPFTVVSSISLV